MSVCNVVFGVSRQDPLDLDFMLFHTYQHDLSVILREMMFPSGFYLVSINCKENTSVSHKVTTELPGLRLTSSRTEEYLQLIGRQGPSVTLGLQAHFFDECQILCNIGSGYLVY